MVVSGLSLMIKGLQVGHLTLEGLSDTHGVEVGHSESTMLSRAKEGDTLSLVFDLVRVVHNTESRVSIDAESDQNSDC